MTGWEPSSGRGRAVAALAAFALAAAAGPGAAHAAETHRSAFTDAGKVRGPLSDFWFKVRSEWGGYSLGQEVSLPEGGGFLRQRARVTPSPTSGWVSLAYGEIPARQADGRPSPLSQLHREFLSEWKQAESRNWPYAQIQDRPWDEIGSLGRRQNIILIGTPWTLPPVGPLAESLGFRMAPGRIEMGRRKYHGDNLILIFIAPNPDQPDKYALVITGSGEEALLQAGHLPYGETDYVLFRGRRLLEAGHFEKPARAAAWLPPRSYEAAGSHRGFAIRESAHFIFWHENGQLSRDDLDVLVAEKEALYPSLTGLLGTNGGGGKLEYFLYPSVDRKIDETERAEVSHVDWAAGQIHTVYSRQVKIVEPYLDMMVLLHRAVGPTRVPRLERALAIALAPSFQGRPLPELAGPVFDELKRKESAVLRSLRDHDVMTPADGPPGPHDVLLAAFLHEMVRRHGGRRALDFVAAASPRTLAREFEQAYGQDLDEALDEWADSLPAASGPSLARSPDARAAAHPEPDGLVRARALLEQRRDGEAAAALEEAPALRRDPRARTLLARARFRRGELDAALAAAGEAIRICSQAAAEPVPAPACAEAEPWARLTLGRVEALRGRHVAARVELTHPAVRSAPAPVPVVAEHWLGTMGLSRNQLTVVSHLKRESRVALRRLDWDSAEKQLHKALEIDPTDGEAHRILSEVYHKQHEFWAWKFRFLNQTHPDYNVLSRTFLPGEATPIARVEHLHNLDVFNDLVLKGNLELLKAQSLYATEIRNLHTEGDRFLLEARDIEAALDAYRRALELNGDFFLSHFLVGRCLFLLDERQAARASLEEVLRRQPSDPLVNAWTHTYLGYIALREDALAEAARSFRQALKLQQDGKVARLAREGLGKVETIRLILPGGAGPR
ncbi:MAG TPA: tetratricopeptide repeat protein [Candidatus Polarisedimenticolia bacterium]|nr:tetratricopeptide repeat protein [Candidatus Polarisedimenticolia bacterium]